MDGREVAVGMQMTEKNGDIAKTDDPLGMFCERRKIELIDDVNGAIAAAGAEDGAKPGVVQHLLEIGGAFGIGAAEDRVLFPYGLTNFDPKSPTLDELRGRQDLLGGDVAGGAGDADSVAGFEIGCDDQWCG